MFSENIASKIELIDIILPIFINAFLTIAFQSFRIFLNGKKLSEFRRCDSSGEFKGLNSGRR